MIDEEEGELEEDDDKGKAGQENQEEQVNDDLYRKLIEDELSDSDVGNQYFYCQRASRAKTLGWRGGRE